MPSPVEIAQREINFGLYRDSLADCWKIRADTGQRVLDALEASGYLVVKADPEHVLDLREDGWTLQHSMTCRLSGALFDCPVNQAVQRRMDEAGPPDEVGRFVVHVDEAGWPRLGEAR